MRNTPHHNVIRHAALQIKRSMLYTRGGWSQFCRDVDISLQRMDAWLTRSTNEMSYTATVAVLEQCEKRGVVFSEHAYRYMGGEWLQIVDTLGNLDQRHPWPEIHTGPTALAPEPVCNNVDGRNTTNNHPHTNVDGAVPGDVSGLSASVST